MSGGSNVLVLVVDDEPAIRLLCRINLELDGFEVAEASTIAEAHGVLDSAPVAAVLLDLRLGQKLSSGLVEECVSREPRIPVALLTGSAEDSLAQAAGADAVLPKPFAVDRLAETVRSLTSAAAR